MFFTPMLTMLPSYGSPSGGMDFHPASAKLGADIIRKDDIGTTLVRRLNHSVKFVEFGIHKLPHLPS